MGIASELECEMTWKRVSLCLRSSDFSPCRCLPALCLWEVVLSECVSTSWLLELGVCACACLHIMCMFESVKSSLS